MTSDNPESQSQSKQRSGFLSRILYPFRHNNRHPSHNNIEDFSLDIDSLEVSQKEMIRGVVQLSEKIAREIMIPRVDIVAIESSCKLKDVITLIFNAGHSRIPVFENTIDNITGILYVKDLLIFLVEKKRKFIIKKLLHKPYFVPETMPLDELLLGFKLRKLHLAIVVDEYGGVAGIITMEDVLEEIVGEIKDEFDEDELPELQKINEGEYEVDSRMTITDFNNETGSTLPTNEFDTIGGMVYDLFGKIPLKNEEISYGDLSFKIKDIKGTRIHRILVTILQGRDDD
ncbi:MAG: hemolysin family protein [Spirochaetota bacterium]